MAKRIIDARVRQKAAPLEEWNNSDLDSLDGEQLFVRSDVDDAVIGFKLGAKNKRFSELPYPDFTVRGKVSTTSTWSGRQSGIYIPTTNGNYNGVQVNLTEGYQVLYWDGSTIEKVVYPNDYAGAVFGGVIDDTYDLSSPTEPIWYIASPGTYNTVPPITLTENSILTWNGEEWSHIPFELEVRGEFLVADNIQEVRNITPDVASLLVNGTYKGVTVLGYYEPNDTPSPINYYLSDTLEPDDGGSVIEVGSIKLKHSFDNKKVNVKYFGAKGDGVYDDTPHLKNVEKYSKVYLPKGRYILKEQLYFGSCELSGDGELNTIIDASSSSTAGFVDSVVSVSGQAPELLATTSVQIKEGDTSITVSETVNIPKDSRLILYNPVDYSYSQYRPSYREGEFVLTRGNTSGDVINIKGTIYGSGYAVSNQVYTIQNSFAKIKGIKIIAMNAGSIVPLRLNYITDGVVEETALDNSDYATMLMRLCCNVVIRKPYYRKETPDVTGTSYGIIVSNCQNVNIYDADIHSRRHAISTGGFNDLAIANRFINAINCNLKTEGTVAYAHHGNAEYCDIIGGNMNGVGLAGRRNRIINAKVTNDEQGNNTCFSLSEVLEPSYTIQGCDIMAYRQTNPSSLAIWMNSIFGDKVTREGLLNVHDNVFRFTNSDSNTVAMKGIQFYGSALSDNKVSMSFEGNEFRNTDLNDNIFRGIYIRKLASATAPESNFKNVFWKNNKYFGNLENSFNNIDNLVIEGNSHFDGHRTGYYINTVKNVFAYDNFSKNGNKFTSGSSALNSFLFVQNVDKVSSGRNIVSGGANTNYAVSLLNVGEAELSPNIVSNLVVREYNIPVTGGVSLLSGKFSGVVNPESNYNAKYGTEYTLIGSSVDVTYIKNTKTGNTGWLVRFGNASTTVKGLVNQGVAVPNGSSVDTLLASLRSAGIIAT